MSFTPMPRKMLLVPTSYVEERRKEIADARLQRVQRGSEKATAVEVLPRFESARTNRVNQAHWSRATGKPINEELAEYLETTRTRSIYEALNNPTIEGVIRTHVGDVVGPAGPTLQLVSESNPEYAAKAEAIWRAWWQRPCCNRKTTGTQLLQLWVRNLWTCGEFLSQIVVKPNYAGPVKHRVLPIHPRRLATPTTSVADPNVVLGVKFDADGDPQGYYVQRVTRFGAYELGTTETKYVPAADILHGFYLLEEDQARGVPWLNSALSPAARMRDYDEAVLDAAENAAQQSMWLYSDNPQAEFGELNETAEIEKGNLIQTAPPGYKPWQLQPTQPSAQYVDYRQERQRDIGRPAGMPLMMVRLDSSKHNYSSARFDGQSYARQIRQLNQFLVDTGLDPLTDVVLREAELAGQLPAAPADLMRIWTWQPLPHVDPKKEREATAQDMSNRTLPWSEACIAEGRDPDVVFARHVADRRRFEAAGLPLPPSVAEPKPATPAAAAPTPAKPNSNGAARHAFV